MAAKATDPTAKETMLTMAAEWRKLAENSGELQAIQSKLANEA